MAIQVSSRVAKTMMQVAALVVTTITTMVPVVAAPTDLLDPRVVPPTALIGSMTYGQWGDVWWNWAVREPSATNPGVDPTGQFGARNQSGPVWFLAGVFGAGFAERTVIVPDDRYIFFPLINTVEASFPGQPEPEAELRFRVNQLIDNVTDLECIIDGVRVRKLFKYRAQSPRGGFVLKVRPNSFLTGFGAPPGDYVPSVADGYWIMLRPLPVGEHKIAFQAFRPDLDPKKPAQRVIYHVHVRKRVG